jgi:hypothetical protein
MKNSMKTRTAILALLLTVCSCLPTVANALGTTANTILVAKSASLNASYTVLVGTPYTVTTIGGDMNSTVAAIYGFSNSLTGGSNQTILRNSLAAYPFLFGNRGNTATTLNLAESISMSGTFGTAWTQTLTPASAPVVGIDQNQGVTLDITSSVTAYDGSSSLSRVTFNINSGLVSGSYTGFNNQSYAGGGLFTFSKTTSITGPDIIFVNKQITNLSAPISGGYQGEATDAVPGAIIEYKITITNQGTTRSILTRIEEVIPTYSVLLSVSVNSSVVETGAGVGAAGDVDYFYGSTYNDTFIDDYISRSAIQKIRFNFLPINAGASRDVIFRVTIKD